MRILEQITINEQYGQYDQSSTPASSRTALNLFNQRLFTKTNSGYFLKASTSTLMSILMAWSSQISQFKPGFPWVGRAHELDEVFQPDHIQDLFKGIPIDLIKGVLHISASHFNISFMGLRCPFIVSETWKNLFERSSSTTSQEGHSMFIAIGRE